MRIFLDANVIFSAIKDDGFVRRLVRLLVEQGHELVADDYVLQEAERNLEAKRGITEAQWVVRELVHVFPLAAPTPLVGEIELVEKDRPVLASAIALRCSALVTSDKAHFGHLYGKCIEGVTIYSPQSIVDEQM